MLSAPAARPRLARRQEARNLALPARSELGLVELFPSWSRIAVNAAISAHRSASRRVRETLPIEEFGLDLAAADKVMDEATDDVRLLRRLVGELDEPSRALVILYLDDAATSWEGAPSGARFVALADRSRGK